MSTSTKRPLTDDVHNAIIASRTQRNDVISEDLTLRLQNIGSRVRKSVYDGYSTQRMASLPSTPHSSPIKPSATPSNITNTMVFRSVNDTLSDVFSSPSAHFTSRTPSPRKRTRPEVEDDEVQLNMSPDIDTDMADAESEDEAVIFLLEPKALRPMKPLRRPISAMDDVINKAPSDKRARETGAPHATITPSSHVTTTDTDLDWFSRAN